MLIKANNNDKNKLLEYLKEGVEDCLYLYIDVTNYSIESDDCQVWYADENSKVDFVIMRYYESYQVFGQKRGYIPQEVADHITENPAKMISGRKDLIEELEKKITGYKATYGKVYNITPKTEGVIVDEVEVASVEDALEIAQLIQTDEGIGAHYSTEGLKKQIIDRIESGTGRSYVIRRDGKIIAHTATYAESADLAVVSGTVVKKEYRNTNVFIKTTTAIQSKLKKDGKRIYTFAFEPRIVAYHDAIHVQCGEYGKMEIN